MVYSTNNSIKNYVVTTSYFPPLCIDLAPFPKEDSLTAQTGVSTLLSLLLTPCAHQEQSMKSICLPVSTFRLKLLDVPGTVLSALQIITCLISLWILGRRWCSITLFLTIRKQRQEGGWVMHPKLHASPGWSRGVNPLFLAVVCPSVQMSFPERGFPWCPTPKSSPIHHHFHVNVSPLQLVRGLIDGSITQMRALRENDLCFSCSLLCTQPLADSLAARRCPTSTCWNTCMHLLTSEYTL